MKSTKKAEFELQSLELEFSWLGLNRFFNTCIDWLKLSVHGPTLLEWAFESNNIILLPQWDTRMEQRFWSCKNAFNLLVFKSLSLFANVNACEFLYNEFIQLSLSLPLLLIPLYRQTIIFYGSFENEQKRERFSEHYIYWKRLPLNLQLDSFKENLLLRNGILCSL